MNTHSFIPFIEELAQVSAEEILPHFGNPNLAIDAKADTSPVTLADRSAEARMRECIQARFPDHGILGEEYGNEQLDAEYVWILDPIDGTKSFISGVPLFTTLIGLLQHGKPILGAIHQPTGKQLCIGDNDHCWLNGKPVKVREHSLSDVTLLTSDPYLIGDYQSPTGWQKLVSSTRIHRSWGDGYGYLLLATGWADIMCDPVLEPWDILPIIPVARGAGAEISDWQGAPVSSKMGEVSRSCVACHPTLHPQVIGLLNS